MAAKKRTDKPSDGNARTDASTNPPGGPAVNADSSGGSELRTRRRKDVDVVAVAVTCRPLSVAVTIHGDVNAGIHCAHEEGSRSLSVRRVQTVDEVGQAPRSAATAVVVALDCHGAEVQCDLRLNEP